MDPTDWLPFYPDLVPRRRSVPGPALASQPPYSPELFPVPDLLAGLTFLPSYPDLVPHRRVPHEQLIVDTAAIFTAAVAPLAWLPVFPDRVPHRRTPLGAHPSCVAPPPSEDVIVAQMLNWLPTFPNRVPHRRLYTSGASWTVLPSLAGLAVPVVGMLDGTLTAPALIVEGLTVTGFSSEGCGTPQFIHEDLE